MTTRDSMEHFINECEQTIDYAKQAFDDGSKQQHYDDWGYNQAQQALEDRYNELMAMNHSANAQQRERLHRMRLKIQSLQNEMILLNH